MNEKELTGVLERLLRKFLPEVGAKTGELVDRVESIRAWLAEKHAQVIPITDKQLFRLAQIPDAPEVLFVQGREVHLEIPAVTVVGTRAASPHGLRAAEMLSRDLASLGFAVVSGLARGIDSAAHRAALKCGGKTWAVLGHGMGHIYPPENRLLASEIIESGGYLISEYPPFLPPRKHFFPARNRILSGLALGTVVVEAPIKSGALITARCALEHNREVFAVPGFFDDPRFGGNQSLIQQGAKLVTCVDDVTAELVGMFGENHDGMLSREFKETSDSEPISSESTKNSATVALKSLFLKFGGSASLNELSEEFPFGFQQLIQVLEAAQRHGWVRELGTQQYAWLNSLSTSDVSLDAPMGGESLE